MFSWRVEGLRPRNRDALVTALAIIAALPLQAPGQLNIWTKPASGYWEEPYWSLGSMPTNGQYVAITNAGWKAVAIGPATTQNYPSNLTLYSLTISSPLNSYNQLLMNYAGLQTPLTTRLLTVASNSSVNMLYSWLDLNGGTGEGLSLGGDFEQDSSSIVTGPQADIGWIGPGVYNLKSGVLALNQMFLGGPYQGQFNQYGGSSRIGLLQLYSGGSYNYYGGDEVPTNIYFLGGTFFIRGGIRYQPIGPGSYVQTGGTNYGAIGFNYYPHGGIYTLSNGVSFIPDLPLGESGHYVQWGGSQTVTGLVTVRADPGGFRSGPQVGSLVINGGTFETTGISLGGDYAQAGGTNTVHGGITLNGQLSALTLDGGVLMDDNVIVNPSYGSYELTQCGGIHIIANELTINGAPGSWALHGVSLCTGAQMIVSNITILNGGALSVADRTITHSGLLRCDSGLIFAGQGTNQFGILQLDGGRAALILPLNSNCVVRFRSSSAVPGWDGSPPPGWAPTLVISNWSGSIYGGGTHEVIFGEGAGALTPSQLNQIVFQDPRGPPPGRYPAGILSTGEIVPKVPPTIRLTVQPDHTVLVGVMGQGGFDYWIETSTNLITWTRWTNGTATNGVMSVVDTETTNAACKFYRSVLLGW